jgi:hypothetical protein
MDVVTYGADAREFFDIHARMGETMLRSERTVARSAGNIVTSLLSSQNAAEALASAFLNLEHATKLGLGLAIGVSVGVALFEALKKAKDEAAALNEEIRNVIASASGPASYSSIDALTAKLASVREEQKKIQEEANKTFSSLAAAIASVDPTQRHGAGGARQVGYNAILAQNEARTQRSAQLRASELETQTKIAAKMGEINDLEDTRLHVSEQTAAINKLDADYAEKRAALIRGPTQNLAAVEQLDRLHALQIEKLQTEFDLENKKSAEQIKQARTASDRLALEVQIESQLGNVVETQARVALIGSDRLESLREEVRFTAELYRNTAGRSIEESLRAQIDYEKALSNLKQETLNRQKSIVGAIREARTAQQSLIMEQAQQDIKTVAQKYEELRANQRLYEALRSRAWQQGMMAPAAPRFGEEYHPFEGTFAERAAGIQALINADFSSLASLSGLDFAGLRALNSLNIIVQ